MSSRTILLTLDPAWSLGEPVRGDDDESPAPPFFLDLVVNGASLRDLVPYTQDMITELNRVSLADIDLIVNVLLARREHNRLDAGRVPLLVCRMCGDLDCGALTVRVSVSGEEVRWSDWRWVDWSGQLREVDAAPDAFTFDRSQYEAVLLSAPARVASFPHVENLRRERRFKWPWEWL